jgi:hypothetical protein
MEEGQIKASFPAEIYRDSSHLAELSHEFPGTSLKNGAKLRILANTVSPLFTRDKSIPVKRRLRQSDLD